MESERGLQRSGCQCERPSDRFTDWRQSWWRILWNQRFTTGRDKQTGEPGPTNLYANTQTQLMALCWWFRLAQGRASPLQRLSFQHRQIQDILNWTQILALPDTLFGCLARPVTQSYVNIAAKDFLVFSGLHASANMTNHSLNVNWFCLFGMAHVTRYGWLMRARVRRLSLSSVLAISISQIIDLEVIWAGQQWIGAQTLPMTLVFGLGILAGIGSWNGLGISGLHGSQKVFRLQKNHRKETQENTEYIHLDTHSHTHTHIHKKFLSSAGAVQTHRTFLDFLWCSEVFLWLHRTQRFGYCGGRQRFNVHRWPCRFGQSCNKSCDRYLGVEGHVNMSGSWQLRNDMSRNCIIVYLTKISAGKSYLSPGMSKHDQLDASGYQKKSK